MDQSKPAEKLNITDLSTQPVWEFINNDSQGESAVCPVKKLPVSNLSGKLVGTQITLANGMQTWALIGNINSENPKTSEHFLTLLVERKGEWFHLARYHDADYANRGPEALAGFNG